MKICVYSLKTCTLFNTRIFCLLQVMPRLRIGIGRPTGKTSVDRHVLGRFTTEEQKLLDSVLVQSVDLLLSQLS